MCTHVEGQVQKSRAAAILNLEPNFALDFKQHRRSRRRWDFSLTLNLVESLQQGKQHGLPQLAAAGAGAWAVCSGRSPLL